MHSKKKRNPDSLCGVFDEIVRTEFRGSPTRAAKALSSSLNAERAGADITHNAIRAIRRNQQYVTYRHLEAAANHLGVPAGAILLLSRLRALKRDDEIEELVRFLNATILFCERAKEKMDLSVAQMARLYQVGRPHNDD